MTAPTAPRTSPIALVGGAIALVAIVVFVSFAGRDDREIGGFGDPLGTGSNGLGALRAMIDESGGTSELGVAAPTADHDVAVLVLPVYIDLLAQFDGTTDDTLANHAPIMEWVRRGGDLVTALDVPEGPGTAGEVVDDEDARIGRGACDAGLVDGVDEIRPLVHAPVAVGADDRSCFGDGSTAVLVVRPLGEGRIIRLAGFGMLSNRALDDADNGAFAARTIGMGPGRSVAFLSGPTGGTGSTVPVNEDGEPVGAGDDSLLELIPDRVLAMLVGFAGAALVYAVARGRRLGSPVVETLPIELPSSSFVEAVGRLHRRTVDPAAHSAELLRHDVRSRIARRVGRPHDAPAAELAALACRDPADADALAALLDGPLPSTPEGLVAFARDLNDRRLRIERPGASSLVGADSPVATPTERNPDDHVPARR